MNIWRDICFCDVMKRKSESIFNCSVLTVILSYRLSILVLGEVLLIEFSRITPFYLLPRTSFRLHLLISTKITIQSVDINNHTENRVRHRFRRHCDPSASMIYSVG